MQSIPSQGHLDKKRDHSTKRRTVIDDDINTKEIHIHFSLLSSQSYSVHLTHSIRSLITFTMSTAAHQQKSHSDMRLRENREELINEEHEHLTKDGNLDHRFKENREGGQENSNDSHGKGQQQSNKSQSQGQKNSDESNEDGLWMHCSKTISLNLPSGL